MIRSGILTFLVVAGLWLTAGALGGVAPAAAQSTPTVEPEAAGSAYDADASYWTKTLPIHPKVVHIPIALCVVMPLIVLVTLVGVMRGWFSPSVWALVALLAAIQCGGAIAALRSGHTAEHEIEGYASDEAIHRHEEAGERFTYASGGLVVLLAAAWALRHRREVALGLAGAALLGTLGTAYLGYRVGDAGGRLVYISGAADAYK